MEGPLISNIQRNINYFIKEIFNMGLFKKDEDIKKQEAISNSKVKNTPPVKTTYTKNSPMSHNLSESVISKELIISGEITGTSNLRIKGTVEGKIELKSNVVVENESKINADIKGNNIEISGTVEGNITAEDKITLNETAIVVGNITCRSFTVKEGASFEGNINMVHSSSKEQKNKGETQKSKNL